MTIEEFCWSRERPMGDGWQWVKTVCWYDGQNKLWKREIPVAQHEGDALPYREGEGGGHA